MADINYNDHASKAAPTVDDFIPIWDVAAGQSKKATIANILNARLTGGGIVATGGFTLTVPATGTAALLGTTQTFTGAKTFSAAVTFSDIIAMAHARTRSDTIADDNVAVITPFQNTGVILINATTFTNTVSGIVSYRAAASPVMFIIAGGSNMESSTSILTGTTGTDGKVTISANSNGNIYLENRMGGSITFRTSFLC